MVLRPTLTLPCWLRCVFCCTCHSRCQRALRRQWHPEAGQERPGYAYTTVGEAAGAAAGHCRRNRGLDTAERIIAIIVPMSRLRAHHRLETNLPVRLSLNPNLVHAGRNLLANRCKGVASCIATPSKRSCVTAEAPGSLCTKSFVALPAKAIKHISARVRVQGSG